MSVVNLCRLIGYSARGGGAGLAVPLCGVGGGRVN